MFRHWTRAAAFVALATIAHAQITQRVSVGWLGKQGNGSSFTHQRIDAASSADGRYVAFWSEASNLVENDTNDKIDVFVRDRQTGTTRRVSVDGNGAQGDGDSRDPSISADGRYVAFWSFATNLVPGDTNDHADAFVHDRETGAIVRASVDSSGVQASNHSFFPAISADGRFVAFESSSPDLVAGDENGVNDVFVRDLQAGTTERASVDSDEVEGNGDSVLAAISSDGRCVVFESDATNLVAGDANGHRDIFLRDRQLGSTEAVSLDSNGELGDGDSRASAVSADGRFVAFQSSATNLVPNDGNGHDDVFLRDRDDSTTTRVSVDSSGNEADGDSLKPSVSADGRFVAFVSLAAHLVPGDTNAAEDVFLRDRIASTTERVSVDSAGRQSSGSSADASISPDGNRIVFTSLADDLVPGDTNDAWDVFSRERFGGPDFTSLCDPGAGGVRDCPCANPAGGPGRGCDNSSSTGGAVLAASGSTSLSSDSLVLEASGERPNALSVVMQGNGSVAGGVVIGQGVRCVGGTIIRRLFVQKASSGAIRVPNFAAGDPTVSLRSAQKGDEITPGESRWYLVYYRDPIVLGLCPASSTFNATQTGQVTWSP